MATRQFQPRPEPVTRVLIKDGEAPQETAAYWKAQYDEAVKWRDRYKAMMELYSRHLEETQTQSLIDGGTAIRAGVRE